MSPYITALYNITNQALSHFAYNAIYTYSWFNIHYRKKYWPAITNAVSTSSAISRTHGLPMKSFVDVYRDCCRVTRIEYDHEKEQYVLSPGEIMMSSVCGDEGGAQQQEPHHPCPYLVMYNDEQQKLIHIVKCFDRREIYEYIFTHPFSVIKSTPEFLMTEVTYHGTKNGKEVTKLIDMKKWQVEGQHLDRYFFYYAIFLFHEDRIEEDEYCSFENFTYTATIIDDCVNQIKVNQNEVVILNKVGYKVIHEDIDETISEPDQLEAMKSICMPESMFLKGLKDIVECGEDDEDVPPPPLRQSQQHERHEQPCTKEDAELLSVYIQSTYMDDYSTVSPVVLGSNASVSPSSAVLVQEIDIVSSNGGTIGEGGDVDYIHV